MEKTPEARGSLDLPRIILPACLFVSGASALAFEVVWAKYLTDLVGSTALAHTVVLSTFMGGLAGGAFLFGNWADRTKRPLVLYGVLELGVAVTCFLFPLVFMLAGALYVKIASPLAEQTTGLIFLRAGLAVATILVPSILMGGTLPAATRFYVRSISEVGSGVARLYFINALGAVLGCLVAGFALVPMLGLTGTLVSAAMLNVIAGCTALVLVVLIMKGKASLQSFLPGSDPSEKEASVAAPGPEGSQEDEESPFPKWVAMVALASIAVAGAASMTYEIVWIRILTLVMGGSTYAFTTMLAAFILGIALGSALVSWKKTRLSRSGLGGFGWLQVLIAAITIISVPLYNRLPYLYHRMAQLLAPIPENYPAFLGAGFLVCLLVMIVPTILLGMTFPIAARLATRSIKTLGGGVGQTYACDTAGTVVGVILAGHLLLPLAGIYGTLVIAAVANLLAGLFCVIGAWWTGPALRSPWARRRRAVAFALAAVVLPTWMLAGPRLERTSFTVGVFRVLRVPFTNYHELALTSKSGAQVLYDRDGSNGTVTVIDYPRNRAMNVNGKTDASDGRDLETQFLAAHLPALIHPDPKSALVVGLGAGATTAGLLAYPDMRVVTAELSREIVEAAGFFSHMNRNVLEDPRFELVLDDVQAWLALSDLKFDLVVSVPSNPWVAGNASLFTVEFFEQIKNHMAPGGILLQWFHDYEMTEEAVETILRTISHSFPHVHLFNAGGIRDYLVICSLEPVDFDAARIDRRIAENPLIREDLSHSHVRSHLGLFARHFMDSGAIREAGGEGRLQRKSRPLLEYQAPKGLFLDQRLDFFQTRDLRRDPDAYDRILLGRRLLLEEPLTEEEWEEVLDAVRSPFEKVRTSLVRAWAGTGSYEGRRRLAWTLMARRQYGEAAREFSVMKEAGTFTPGDAVREAMALLEVAHEEGHALLPGHVDSLYQDMYGAALECGSEECFRLAGVTARTLGRPDQAARFFEAAAATSPDDRPWPRVSHLISAADARRRMGDREGALRIVEEAIGLAPTSSSAQVLRVQILSD